MESVASDWAESYQPGVRELCGRVFLDCGADEAPMDPERISVEPWGLRLEVPWRFDVGVCLEVKIRVNTESRAARQIETVVASCEPLLSVGAGRLFELTLLYLDAVDACTEEFNGAGMPLNTAESDAAF